jgi:inosose dehydratase
MSNSDHGGKGSIGIAINPVQWLATDDGWLDFSRRIEPLHLLEQIKEAGYDGVAADLAEIQTGWSLEQYRRVLDDIGLEVATGYLTVHLPEQGVEQAVMIDRAMAAAHNHAALGLKDIFISAGMFKDALRVQHPAQGRSPDESRLQRMKELMGIVANTTLAEGVRSALHQHVGTFIETEEETRNVLDAFDGRTLGFGPDTGHLSWARVNVRGMIHDYSDRVQAVHVKDCRMSVADKAREADLTYQQTVAAGLWVEPGRGELPLESMLAELPRGFSGWLIVEVDRPDIADPFESAKASAAWMRAYVSTASPTV